MTHRLPRSLGTWSATAIVVSSIVGSGIYRVPASIAADVGSVGAILALWVLGGVIALCGALSLAELAVAFPRSGGIYVILRETYGPLAAFLFGWAMLVVNPAAYAAVGLIFAASLRALFDFPERFDRVVAAAMIVVLVGVNIRSVRFGAAIQNASTSVKVIALAALSVAAIALGDSSRGAFAGTIDFAPFSATGFGIALIAVLFAYDGWQWVPQIAEELHDPERALPRALGGGVLLVTIVYLVTNVANFSVLSLPDIATSSLVTADVARRIAGELGATFVAALIALSTMSSNHGGFTTDPRVFYAMATDGLFFRSVAAVHPRHGTPYRAVLVMGAVAVVYVFVRPFERLAETLVVGMWPFLAMSVAGLFVLRRREAPASPRRFRVPGYPWTPGFFLAACVALIGNALVDNPVLTLTNFAVLAAGAPAYWLWRAGQRRRRDAAAE